MPRLGVDLNAGGAVPDGSYIAPLKGVVFKIKTGEKFNAKGTTDVDPQTFVSHPTQKEETWVDESTGETVTKMKAQSKITFEFETEKGRVWADIFMSKASMFMAKKAFKALSIPYADDGSFDTDDVLGAISNQCLVDVIINDKGFNEVTGIQAA